MKSDKLIFLISQPRSGSSLLQQLLLNSDKINSSPEPWQMLSLIYTYKENSITSEYNPNFAVINFKRYLETIDNGFEDYKNKIKALALELYSKKCKKGNFYLDKTPRYYHIIEELYELFPEAKFIFLVRNPINVFASILDYNFSGDYSKYLSSNDRIDDLFLAPKKIKNALKNYSNNVLIKYEDIILNPSYELAKIYEYISVDIPENTTNYSLEKDFVDSSAIDTKSLYRHNMPTKDYLDSWKKALNTSKKKKLALEFLKILKSSNNEYFGYEMDSLINEVRIHKPNKNTLFDLNFGYFSNPDEKLSFIQLNKKRIFLKLQEIEEKWLKK